MKATVFYEDAPGVAVTNYGPHLLALACVADRLVGEWNYTLHRYADAVPMKRDSKLRAVLRGIGGRCMIAVFDSDHVRDLYDLAQDSSSEEVIAAIKVEAGSSVDVVLLENNAEDLVRHCCTAMQELPPSFKPIPEERDRILHRAAAASADVRARVLQLCPSFGLLVDSLQRTIELIRTNEAVRTTSE